MSSRVTETVDPEIGPYELELVSNKSGKKWAYHFTTAGPLKSGRGTIGHPYKSEDEARTEAHKEIAIDVEARMSGESGAWLVGTKDDPGLHRIG